MSHRMVRWRTAKSMSEVRPSYLCAVFAVIGWLLLATPSVAAQESNEVIVKEIVAKINREYPRHSLKPWQLRRFVQGSRIVAEHYGMREKSHHIRFAAIAWKLGNLGRKTLL